MSSQSFDPERWLAGLEPIGWRLGLDRIRALLAELGEPQREFESVHVVGTNGKSSVAAMIAALVEAGGRSAGCYLSPHTASWAERVTIAGRSIDRGAFAVAAERVAGALASVERELSGDERITQFEAATAVAFCALADAGVEVGVIEAGLGGRLDATNVLDSSVTVLTSVGLDHTAWLGETELEIAAEKLAVLKPDSVLVLGSVSEPVAGLAREVAAERRARLAEPGADTAPADAPPYLRRNFAVARAAALEVGGTGDREHAERALAAVELRGRFEWLPGGPPLVIDAAHNPPGAAALAEALAASANGRPVFACLAILADKDAAGIARALAPALAGAVATTIPAARLGGSGRPGAEALSAADLCAVLESEGIAASAEDDPAMAITLALRCARDHSGLALVAGSHYLLPYAWTERHAQSSFR